MKKLLFIALSLLNFSLVNAQNKQLDIVWEEKNIINKSNNIASPYYIGSNSSGHYAVSGKYMPSYTTYTLMLFDAKTNLITSTIDIEGRKMSNKALKSEVGSKGYAEIVVMEDKVHVFYKNYRGFGDQLYVVTFDTDLKTFSPIKKLCERPSSATGKSITGSDYFIFGNSKLNNNIVVGYEKGIRGQESIIEWKIYNEKFELIETKEAQLPFVFNLVPSGDYSFLSTGHVLISTRIKEEIPNDSENTRRKKNFWYYHVYTIVNISTGEIKVLPLRDANNNVIMFPYTREVNGSLVIDACYYQSDDIIKNNDQNYMEGTFHAEIDLAKGTLSKSNFTPFDDKTYHTIYNPSKTNNTDSKKEAGSAPPTELKTEIVLENNGNLYYVCSKFGEQIKYIGDEKNNQVIYTLVKGEIILMKINSDNTIEWCQTIDRNKTFDSWDEADIDAKIQNDDILCMYLSDSKVVDKKGQEVPANEFIEFVTADINSGAVHNEVLLLNGAAQDAKNKKELVRKFCFTHEDQLISFGITNQDKNQFLSLIKFTLK